MRVVMDLQRRALDSSMHLRRAIELRAKASERTMSEVAKEMIEEATTHEAIAYSLMDYSEPSEKSGGTLITPTPDIDLKQFDQPKPEVSRPSEDK